jgi:Ca2+-transporting ATPase
MQKSYDKYMTIQTNYYEKSRDLVLNELESDIDQGLSQLDAQKRLNLYQRNEISFKKRPSLVVIFILQFKNVIVLLLLATAFISFALNEIAEAISILLVIIINSLIGFFSEVKAIRSIDALRKLGATKTLVLRDGKLQQIDATLLVPGDIVALEAGDSITADMRLLEVSKVTVNESILTGESLPVLKQVEAISSETILAERTNMIFKGTHISTGTCKAIVTHTGLNTEVGKISQLTDESHQETTPLEKRLDKLGQQLLLASFLIAIILTVLGVITGKPLMIIIETAIVLAIATIPEGLPIVSTLALAKGMLIMAKNNAIVNKLSAVETLGATSVIFSDKTGTLTENKMKVGEVLLYENDEETFLKVITLCNNASIEQESVGDPMEVALLEYSLSKSMNKSDLSVKYPEVREVSFDSSNMMMATIHDDKSNSLIAFVKGAPEQVLQVSRLPNSEKDIWLKKNTELANDGYRVIATAVKTLHDSSETPYVDLQFIGLVGLVDPPREDVKDAIKKCHQAGIKVVMMTGDQGGTATKIAKDVELDIANQYLSKSGKDLGEISAEQLDKGLFDISIFSRFSPEQKLRMIEYYQKNDQIVAMTGDGVNDAPALKKSDIGVAMGLRGTQVAKEAADIVLLDDKFATIITAIKQGRIIFTNIKRFVIYLLSCNISEVLTVAIAVGLNFPIPLLPLQILFLNLVTDVFPALALGFGGGDESYLNNPPRKKAAPILSPSDWKLVILFGILLTTCVLFVFIYSIKVLEVTEAKSITMAFITLALSQTVHVFNMKRVKSSFLINDITRNKYVWGAVILCTLLIIISIKLPILKNALGLVELNPTEWFIVTIGSITPLLFGYILSILQIGVRH